MSFRENYFRGSSSRGFHSSTPYRPRGRGFNSSSIDHHSSPRGSYSFSSPSRGRGSSYTPSSGYSRPSSRSFSRGSPGFYSKGESIGTRRSDSFSSPKSFRRDTSHERKPEYYSSRAGIKRHYQGDRDSSPELSYSRRSSSRITPPRSSGGYSGYGYREHSSRYSADRHEERFSPKRHAPDNSYVSRGTAPYRSRGFRVSRVATRRPIPSLARVTRGIFRYNDGYSSRGETGGRFSRIGRPTFGGRFQSFEDKGVAIVHKPRYARRFGSKGSSPRSSSDENEEEKAADDGSKEDDKPDGAQEEAGKGSGDKDGSDTDKMEVDSDGTDEKKAVDKAGKAKEATKPADGAPTYTRSGRLYIELECPHCKEKFLTFAQYDWHLQGTKHIAALRDIALKHSATLAKMRIEQREEQKKIEDAAEASGTALPATTNFCHVCKLGFRVPRADHQKSKMHSTIHKFLMPYCSVCALTFKSPMFYERHVASQEHIKAAYLRKVHKKEKANKKEALEKGSGDETELKLENLITVDSVGDVDEVVGTAGMEQEAESPKKKPSPAKKPVRPSDKKEVKSEPRSAKVKDETDGIVGEEYIVRVYFCELCQRYLSRSMSSSISIPTHCSSHIHVQNYKMYHGSSKSYKASSSSSKTSSTKTSKPADVKPKPKPAPRKVVPKKTTSDAATPIVVDLTEVADDAGVRAETKMEVDASKVEEKVEGKPDAVAKDEPTDENMETVAATDGAANEANEANEETAEENEKAGPVAAAASETEPEPTAGDEDEDAEKEERWNRLRNREKKEPVVRVTRTRTATKEAAEAVVAEAATVNGETNEAE